jgi:hypothetical protein
MTVARGEGGAKSGKLTGIREGKVRKSPEAKRSMAWWILGRRPVG